MSVHFIHLSRVHNYTKVPQPSVNLLQGLSIVGEAQCSDTVQHVYDQRKNPDKPNLKRVHLIPIKLLSTPSSRDYHGLPVLAGEMGENITNQDLNLYTLGVGSRLQFTHGGQCGANVLWEIVDLPSARRS